MWEISSRIWAVEDQNSNFVCLNRIFNFGRMNSHQAELCNPYHLIDMYFWTSVEFWTSANDWLFIFPELKFYSHYPLENQKCSNIKPLPISSTPHISPTYPPPPPPQKTVRPPPLPFPICSIFGSPHPPHTHTHTNTHTHTHTHTQTNTTCIHNSSFPLNISNILVQRFPPNVCAVYARPPTLHTIHTCEGYNNRFNVRLGRTVKPEFWNFFKILKKEEKLAEAN